MPDLLPTVRAAKKSDLPAILSIYNDAVANTTAVWNETPADLAERAAWLESRIAAGFPVLVADREEAILGYASYGPFRPFEGYRHTAELSIYVAASARGRGVGRLLLETLLDEARRGDLHVLIGGIEAGNHASLRLHRACGFKETARMPQVGRKFGRWLDLVFMQRVLGEAPETGDTEQQ